LNGDYLDQGPTIRRHVEVTAVNHIGKEANHWEEQFYLGFDEDEQIEYGQSPAEQKAFLEKLKTRIGESGQRHLASESGMSRRTVARMMKGKTLRKMSLAKLARALTNYSH